MADVLEKINKIKIYISLQIIRDNYKLALFLLTLMNESCVYNPNAITWNSDDV